MDFKLGELFSGPGGLGLGATKAKVSDSKGIIYSVTHNWASDYDEDSCETYSKNLAEGDRSSVICEDINMLDLNKLSSIDAFAYGFPCNDFSLVGEQKGISGKFGPLYKHGIRVLDKWNPKFFVAENVGGLSSANEGKTFELIKKELAEAGSGYNIVVHKYKSEDYGVAQKRHRIIIVGIRKDLEVFYRVPKPTTKDSPIGVKAVLENPNTTGLPNNESTRQSEIVVERLKHIMPGQNVWNAKLPDHLKLNVKGAKLSQIYRKLHPDEPSYTITGSGGGGTHGYHYKENRALTNRERARIQSFPDNYIFSGSKESVRKQIGMAVPPKLAEQIFTAILKSFAGIEYDHIEPNL